MPELTVEEQRAVFRDWLDRRAPGASVTMRETHVSLLAFTGDRVWKCKKAVRFPFVDLSTAARRAANCEREVALNRRMTEDVYLGIVPLDDASGRVVDHLVEMRRLPDDLRLASVCASGAGESCVDRLADLLVAFHAAAPTGGAIDRAAEPGAIARLWERSITELQPFGGNVLDVDVLGAVAADATQYLAGRHPLFRDRIERGRARDGHGDLLADDVFCLPDGPRVLDCLEFDDALRFGDVLADVAFLAMDLERLGRTDLADRFLERYSLTAGDPWPASLVHFFIAYRALVRAKVASLRVVDDPPAADAARALLGLAASHLFRGRVRIVLVGGPPATGKSTLAQALGGLTGWPVLRSDETRKRLAGLAATTSAAAPRDEGLYTRRWTERTYAALLDDARTALVSGGSVILDASWSGGARRAAAAGVAAETHSELWAFECHVDPATADARAARRAAMGSDASDAGPAIAADLRARFEPWPDAVVVDTGDTLAAHARTVARRMGVDVSAR